MEWENRKREDEAVALRKFGSKASDRLRPRLVALTRPHAVASPDRRADEVNCKPPQNNGERRLHEFPSRSHFCNRQAESFRGASLRWLGEVRVPKLRSYCGAHEMLQRTAKSRYCVRGHLTGTATLGSVSKLTASVSQPARRVFPVSGQRVKISGIRNGPSKKTQVTAIRALPATGLMVDRST
jgi:hypothetical protein